jgi:hypothetical protein
MREPAGRCGNSRRIEQRVDDLKIDMILGAGVSGAGVQGDDLSRSTPNGRDNSAGVARCQVKIQKGVGRVVFTDEADDPPLASYLYY